MVMLGRPVILHSREEPSTEPSVSPPLYRFAVSRCGTSGIPLPQAHNTRCQMAILAQQFVCQKVSVYIIRSLNLHELPEI